MIQNYKKALYAVAVASLLMLTGCQLTRDAGKSNYRITKVEGRMINIDSRWDAHPDSNAVALLKPYKEEVDKMYDVIGVSVEKMDKGRPEGLLSNLVADVIRQAAEKVQSKPADMGLVNTGGLRNILPAGNITEATIFEILPFENSLCVLTMKGIHMKNLLASIASLNGEAVSGVRMEITKDGKLLSCSIGGQPIDENKLYTVATIDYLADGNGSMDAFLQAEKRECPDDATLRDLFIEYVKKQTAAGKKITSALDGRITVK